MKTQIISSALANGNNASDLIPGTTWTYFDAASTAKELNREARLFPKHRHPVPMPRRSSMTRSASFMDNFLKETGWSWADAVDEAKKTGRDRRPSSLRLYETSKAPVFSSPVV